MLRNDYSKLQASLFVFFVSAFFHEVSYLRLQFLECLIHTVIPLFHFLKGTGALINVVINTGSFFPNK